MQDPAQLESTVFGGAIALLPVQRASYLKAACGDNDALRERLEALLAAHEQSEGLLAEAAPAAKQTMK